MIITRSVLSAQNEFVSVKDSRFTLKDMEFSFLGFNAYYLQNEAAKGNRYIVDDVFNAARECSAKVIRTWAFYEAGKLTYPGVIRYSPGEYNEKALESLDYVLLKAKENDVKLILTLANANPDFGGINQYIDWANSFLAPGAGGRAYVYRDFFLNQTIKQWYKDYVYLLLNRTNTLTGIKYKDDPSIFAFEMINEAENLSEDFNLVLRWYDEISTYIRKIDSNHLIATGEAGYDMMDHLYADADFFYNSSYFLFDGCKGTSYYLNSDLMNVDITSYHLYPDGWQISASSGSTWINDHEVIASKLNKPSLLGEFGIRNNKPEVYRQWLSSIEKTRNKSALAWQYLHPDIISDDDGFGFSNIDIEIMQLIRTYNENLKNNVAKEVQVVSSAELFQNYPNPFNPVTFIRYSLPEDQEISLELFNALGQMIAVIDKGIKQKGEHIVTLSLDDNALSSGAYFYTLKTQGEIQSKKLMLLK